MGGPKMVLEKELQVFETRKTDWLKHHEGKYALVRDEEVVGFFDTAEAAYIEGVGKWGNMPFLVKQILEEEVVEQSPALMCGLLHAHT